MDGDQLTTDQAKVLYDQLGPSLRFLNKFRQRIDERGFPKDDALRQLVEAAHDSVFRLSVDLHYRSCKGGVYRKPRANLEP